MKEKYLTIVYDLCKEYAYKREYFAHSIDPLKELREIQPMSACISAFEGFFNFCYIRNEIVMSLFDVLTYEKAISNKLFGLIEDKFSIQSLKQNLIFYIEGYANIINNNL